MLDVVTGEILQTVERAHCGTDALCAMLARFLEVDRDAKLTATVEAALANLEDAGLVEEAIEDVRDGGSTGVTR